jgi:hypothetical protein
MWPTSNLSSQLKRERCAMVNNNYIALDETTLIGWVDKALN